MDINCIVNKRSVAKNPALRSAQKNARRYYGEKLFMRAPNAPKAKIRKLADLSRVAYRAVSDCELSGAAPEKLTRDELTELCGRAGLTGRSGSGFAVSEKLRAFHADRGTLVINGVECDPGLVTDSWLYRNKRPQIERGALLLKSALGLERIILATKEPLLDVRGVEQKKVADRFPLGYEKYLVRYLLGVELSERELPSDRGVLVMNLQTVVAIAEASQNPAAGQYRYITAANLSSAEAKVVRVRIGEAAENVAAACFSESERCGLRLFVGGGAFSCREAAAGEAITDMTGYVAIGDMPPYEDASPCKGCGACTRNCPAGVSVHKIVRHIERNGLTDAGKCAGFHAASCIGCGACTYGCRAGKDVRKLVMRAKEAAQA